MKSQIKKEIEELKKEKNAIILAHNYQPKEIQEIADFIGDSLELCIKANELEDKDIVVFCGVDFMAETAYILNPDKKILIPVSEAECPMAHMLTGSQLKKTIKKYPNAAVCLYVNSLADSKQYATTLCTSANAVDVTNDLEENEVIFGPDNNLGKHVEQRTNKKIIPVPGDGYCYVHDNFTVEDIEKSRKKYPNAIIICHPECSVDVQEKCDEILSTGGMMKYIANSDNEEFVIGTEVDLITRINNEIPGKKVYPLKEDAICDNMKVNTLEKVKKCLINEYPQVTLDKEIAEKSLQAVKRMLEVSN